MKKQDKVIAFKLNTELLEKITLVAAQEDRSLSAMIRIAIKEYTNNYFKD